MEHLFLAQARPEGKLSHSTIKKYERALQGLRSLHSEIKESHLATKTLKERFLTLAGIFADIYALSGDQPDSPTLPCSAIYECASIMHELATVDADNPDDFQTGASFYLDHCFCALGLPHAEIARDFSSENSNLKRIASLADELYQLDEYASSPLLVNLGVRELVQQASDLAAGDPRFEPLRCASVLLSQNKDLGSDSFSYQVQHVYKEVFPNSASLRGAQ